jgi:hypothetical protein
MKITDVRPHHGYSEGKIGKLPDGRTINVRPDSSSKIPTLEVYDPTTGLKIKFRYL